MTTNSGLDGMTVDEIDATLPGDLRLAEVSGWMPLGTEGKWIDTYGWVVAAGHAFAYGHVQDTIDRASGWGFTPAAAVADFRRRVASDSRVASGMEARYGR